MTVYNEQAFQVLLEKLPNWTFQNNGIVKKFQFINFIEALAFIVKVGVLSEKMNHHPEIYNVYNKVSIRLTTHDAQGVTDKDYNLAVAIDTV
jgi:4a-hydroxytetrahydrobiopterin dehydratase